MTKYADTAKYNIMPICEPKIHFSLTLKLECFHNKTYQMFER